MSRILLLPGDGIGPEVTREARRVLEAAAAEAVREAVAAALAEGHRTADLTGPGAASVGCRAMGDVVLAKLEAT